MTRILATDNRFLMKVENTLEYMVDGQKIGVVLDI
jgi:hypothetical protein